MKEPYDDGGVPLGSRGVDWIADDPVRSAQRQAWRDSRDMCDLGGGKDGPEEILPTPEEVERLARRMCAALGEDPDWREQIQISSGHRVASGVIRHPQYEHRPRWRHYVPDAVKWFAGEVYRKETGL